MSEIMLMRITYFVIFVVVFLGFDWYLNQRSKKPEVLFLGVESKRFKIFVLVLAASVLIMDTFTGVASRFVYAVLFFSYAYNFKEITNSGVVNNLKVIKLEQIDKLAIEHKNKVNYVRIHCGTKVHEMIVRDSFSNGLEAAVNELNAIIQKRSKKK